MLNQHTSDNFSDNSAFLDFTEEYEDKKDLIKFMEDEAFEDDDDEFENINDFIADRKKAPPQTGIKKTFSNFQEHFESFVKKFKDTKEEEETIEEDAEENDNDNSLVRDIKNLQKSKKKASSKSKIAGYDDIDDDDFIDVATEHKLKKQASLEAQKILDDARAEATKILEESEIKANQRVAIAQKVGYDEGYEKGHHDAFLESSEKFQEKIEEYLAKIQADIDSINKQRHLLMTEQTAEMRDLAIAVAEKVINISLKNSGNIIEKMVETATERIRNATWAKLHISQLDWELAIKADAQILNTLKKATDTVKIEIIDNDEQGTCIIELPDRIIDASVKTQLDKIRSVLESAN